MSERIDEVLAYLFDKGAESAQDGRLVNKAAYVEMARDRILALLPEEREECDHEYVSIVGVSACEKCGKIANRVPEEREPNIETLLRRVGEGDHYAPEVSWDDDRKAWNVEWLHRRGQRVAAGVSDTGYPWAAILNGEKLKGTDLDGLMAALDKYDAIVDDVVGRDR